MDGLCFLTSPSACATAYTIPTSNTQIQFTVPSSTYLSAKTYNLFLQAYGSGRNLTQTFTVTAPTPMPVLTPTPTPTPTISQIDFAVTSVSVSPSSVVAGSSITVSAIFYNPSNTTQSIQVTIGKGVSSTSDGTVMSTTYYLSLPPGNTTQTQTFTASYGAYSSAPSSPANTYYPEASISGVGNGSIYINPYDPNTSNNYLRATTAYIVTGVSTPTPTPTTSYSNNSVLTVTRLLPGQYDNTKYSLSLSDPEGLGDISVNKSGGELLWIGNPRLVVPPCPTGPIISGMTTLNPSDFPLSGYVIDCINTGVQFPVQVNMPTLPTSSVSVDFSKNNLAGKSRFDRNLYFGLTGNDVKQLQALLVNEVGYSANLITGYFGRITRDAVVRLQEKYSIKPALGYFGEITRRALNAFMSN